MSIKSYSPDDIKLFIGTYQITQFGSDSAVTITRNEDINTEQVGLSGVDVVINRNLSKVGTLTFTLQGVSDDDMLFDELSAYAESNGVYKFPVTFLIASTNKILETVGWLKTSADISVGSQFEDRQHVIGIANSVPSVASTADSLLNNFEWDEN